MVYEFRDLLISFVFRKSKSYIHCNSADNMYLLYNNVLNQSIIHSAMKLLTLMLCEKLDAAVLVLSVIRS